MVVFKGFHSFQVCHGFSSFSRFPQSFFFRIFSRVTFFLKFSKISPFFQDFFVSVFFCHGLCWGVSISSIVFFSFFQFLNVVHFSGISCFQGLCSVLSSFSDGVHCFSSFSGFARVFHCVSCFFFSVYSSERARDNHNTKLHKEVTQSSVFAVPATQSPPAQHADGHL